MLVTLLVAQESRSINEVIVGKKNGSEQDRAGIERLHQQDAAATLSDKADELAKLWDNDAVRIQPVLGFRPPGDVRSRGARDRRGWRIAW